MRIAAQTAARVPWSGHLSSIPAKAAQINAEALIRPGNSHVKRSAEKYRSPWQVSSPYCDPPDITSYKMRIQYLFGK
jgi:hypothetical protein